MARLSRTRRLSGRPHGPTGVGLARGQTLASLGSSGYARLYRRCQIGRIIAVVLVLEIRATVITVSKQAFQTGCVLEVCVISVNSCKQ